jgi:ribonuclease E
MGESVDALDPAAPLGFVDTTPSPQAAEGAEGGRRRNRRGGRGRDRDAANGVDVARDASVDGETMPVAASGDAADLAERDARAESGEGTIEEAGAPSDTRGETSGSRRRRGGRGRDRERGPREALGSDGSETTEAGREPAPDGDAVATVRAEEPTEAAPPRRERQPVFSQPLEAAEPTAMPVAAPTPREAEPARERPQAAEPRPAPVVASAPAPVSAPAPLPGTVGAPDYVLPIDSLNAVAGDAGLQWVNSDADKIRAAQEAMAALPAPTRVAREIPKVELAEDGPLVLVETKKDLSQVRLPFENQPPTA